MSQTLELTIQSTIFDKKRFFKITPEFIEFEDHDLTDPPVTKFLKSEIVALRYGIKWINGYRFTIGRVYCIDIKNDQNKVIKIRLKTIYRIKRKMLREKYSTIVNAIFNNFFLDIVNLYLDRFNNSERIELIGVLLTDDGVRLSKKSEMISWLELGTKNYASYYALFSLKDPNFYKAFEYVNDWNAYLLYAVVTQILKNKNLFKA
ncbi:MAG: hypothetical protein JST75_22020 [Bacteroidetes bacterium]|nr:hypothetical protein [Bacteroidota bacterium]